MTTASDMTGSMSSVVRTFRVLEVIAKLQPVSLHELMQEFDFAKTTLQRTLASLSTAGWIRRSTTGGAQWEISNRALAVRPLGVNTGELIAAAHVPMVALRDATDETVHLSVLDGVQNTVLIDRVDTTQPVRTFSPIGDMSPIHATATGKAALAFLPNQEVEAVIRRGLEQYQPATIVEPEALVDELQVIREHGYAVNRQEYRAAVCSIGAPVRDAYGRPYASLCLSMPSSRFQERLDDDPDLEAHWGLLVAQAADEIDALLSHAH